MTLRSNSEMWDFCISERGKYVRNRASPEYTTWHRMCLRCYDEREKAKHPTYTDCTMSEKFKNFQWFAEWCNSQIGWGSNGYQLDKDLLFKGNKLYSEYTCVFLPKRINTLLVNCDDSQRDLPIGVYLDSRDKIVKYIALCRDGHGKKINLGRYDCADDASIAYTNFKKEVLRRAASEYAGRLDERAILALTKYGD